MTTMNDERLNALIAAYGADPARWPEGEREAGRARLGAGAPGLDEARDLDRLLAASVNPTVSLSLSERVIAAGLGVHATPARVRLWRDRLALAFGAGWAAAACAGVVAGVLVSGQIGATDRADAVLYQASQPTLDDSEMLG
jgi:hypothetical protein